MEHLARAIRSFGLGSACLLAFAVGQGCVLAVPEEGSLETTTCHFQGEQTDCGECIRDNCQLAVNSCCGEGACNSQLSALDSCAEHGAADDCTAVATSSSAGVMAIGECIAKTCAASCFSATVESSSGASGGISCQSMTDLCSCSVNGFGDTGLGTPVQSCEGTSGSGFTCCAQTGWPTSVTSECNCFTDFPNCDGETTPVSYCGP